MTQTLLVFIIFNSGLQQVAPFFMGGFSLELIKTILGSWVESEVGGVFVFSHMMG